MVGLRSYNSCAFRQLDCHDCAIPRFVRYLSTEYAIENLCLRFQRRGVFQQFNDTVAALGRVNYFDDFGAHKSVVKPFDQAGSLTTE